MVYVEKLRGQGVYRDEVEAREGLYGQNENQSVYIAKLEIRESI